MWLCLLCRAGFIQAKCGKDASAEEFYKAVVASRAFDVFIEEDHGDPDPYHVRDI